MSRRILSERLHFHGLVMCIYVGQEVQERMCREKGEEEGWEGVENERLNLVVAELVDDLAGRLVVPVEVASRPIVDVSAALARAPVRVGRLDLGAADEGTRSGGGLLGLRQHAVLGFRLAPVHRLRTEERGEGLN